MSAPSELGPIWVFDQNSLEKALASYQQEALDAYPQQQERILITIAAVRDLLHSHHAKHLLMRPVGSA